MFKSFRNNPFPFKVVDSSNLVKNWKPAIDLHTSFAFYAKKIKLSIPKYVYLTYLQNGIVKGFRNYFEEELQTFSFIEISPKNLTEAVNKLIKIDIIEMNKAKIHTKFSKMVRF